MMIVLEFHVILLIICDCRASIVELRNAKNRAQGGPVREPIKTGTQTITDHPKNPLSSIVRIRPVVNKTRYIPISRTALTLL